MSKSDEIVDKYDGLGDFVRNASKEDKKAVMTEVAEKAAQDQAQMIENYKWYQKGKRDRDEELLEVVEGMIDKRDWEAEGFPQGTIDEMGGWNKALTEIKNHLTNE